MVITLNFKKSCFFFKFQKNINIYPVVFLYADDSVRVFVECLTSSFFYLTVLIFTGLKCRIQLWDHTWLLRGFCTLLLREVSDSLLRYVFRHRLLPSSPILSVVPLEKPTLGKAEKSTLKSLSASVSHLESDSFNYICVYYSLNHLTVSNVCSVHVALHLTSQWSCIVYSILSTPLFG